MTIGYDPAFLLISHPILFFGALVSGIGWLICQLKGKKKGAVVLGLTTILCVISLIHTRAEEEMLLRRNYSTGMAYATAAALTEGHADAVSQIYIDFIKTVPMDTSRELTTAMATVQSRLCNLLKGTNQSLTFSLSDEPGKPQVRWHVK